MSDYKVVARSDKQVRDALQRARAAFGVPLTSPVNVWRWIRSDTVLTVEGVRCLSYITVSDRDMGDSDGTTLFEKGRIVISVKKSVDDRAHFGEGNAKMTLAHELSHAVLLHDCGPNAPMHRKTLASGRHVGYLRSFESAEHQAKVGASAFLIVDELFEQVTDAKELAVTAGITESAARVYIERRQRLASSAADKASVAETLRKFFDRPKLDMSGQKFIAAVCKNCDRRTIVDIDHSFQCLTCNTTYGRGK
jgi:hypothetical protein